MQKASRSWSRKSYVMLLGPSGAGPLLTAFSLSRSALSKDVKDVATLQQYWDKHHARDNKSQEATKTSSLDSPSVTFQSPTVRTPTRGHARKRSASDGAGMLTSGHKLSPYHPAWSLTNLLDTFGPLIFPIHRAAMLRKRILISCHAPVRESCNFGMCCAYSAC